MRTIYSGRLLVSLPFAAIMMVACTGKDAQTTAGQQPREIQLAPSPVAEPQLNDVAPADVPAPTPAPAPAPPPAARTARAPAPAPAKVTVTRIATPDAAPSPSAAEAPPTGTIDAGTTLRVSPASRICTNTHRAGDRITTTLGDGVTGSNAALIPAGSAVVLRVVESARSENTRNDVRLTFDVVSVRVGDETYEVGGRVTQVAQLEKVRAQSTGTQAGKVGAGAAIGAIAGQLLGKDTRSTVIGAAVGAAAGGAVAAGTADYDGCLPAGGSITITLDRPLTIRVGAM